MGFLRRASPAGQSKNQAGGGGRSAPPIRKGKGLQDMLPGCRLMLVACLSALVCGWFFLLLSAFLPAPALVVP